MTIDKKIEELKIVLPEAKAPVGSYVATKIVGKLLHQVKLNVINIGPILKKLV